MFNQNFDNYDSYIELKNRIEIIKLKKIIGDSLLNDEFKNEINDYLFINDKEFNEELLDNVLHLDDILSIIINTINDIKDYSQDIELFKKETKIKMDNIYKKKKKPIYFNILKSLPRKNGVFYTTPYIVQNNRTGDKYSIISQGIYEYKEYGFYITYFTGELMKAISFLSCEKIDEKLDNIALVSLPRSTVGFESTIQQSIDIIEKWYDIGKTDLEFNCSKKVINCKGLLTRIETIEQSSKGANLSEEDHLNSIACNINSNIDFDNTTFILLDDITTNGTIMHACKKLLINENIKPRNIYMLAIGGTRGY